jgi:RNA polymerase sigma factor (sigma-70 family)
MAGAHLQTVVRHLRRRVGTDGAGSPSDAQLLERFVTAGDEAAFELLLWRHGAMVLRLCRRILRHEQDAEDAFQAAFLALARKAGSVSRRGSVGGWLYAVAYRAALTAKARADRRSAREAPLTDVPAPSAAAEADGRDLRPVLDEEIQRLPDRYRGPVVLCYLEGLTVAEAAARLGRPRGTIGTRLARARERLRARLTRRGLGPSAIALTAALTDPAPARPAASLIAATLRVAAGAAPGPILTLTEGVLRAMFLSQFKSVMTAVVVAAALGAGGLAVRTLAADGPSGPTAPPGSAQAARLTLGGWGTAIDPDGDCAFTAARHTLTITVPDTEHNLIAERGLMNSPRVLHEVEGDFVLQVRVTCDFPRGAKGVTEQRPPFHGAGLLVYQDDRTYLRLERAEAVHDGTPHNYANWELRRDGTVARAGGPRDGGIERHAPTWLRLERRGAWVYGYHSTDGVTWTALEPIEVSLPRRVRVGVSATHNTSTGFAPAFEGLQLYQAVVSLPLPAEVPVRGTALLMNAGTLTFPYLGNVNTTMSGGTLTLNGTFTPGLLLNTTAQPSLLVGNRYGVLTTTAQPLTAANAAQPDPGPPFKVGEIKIVGNTQIAEDAIRERLGLTPGQVVTPADVRQAQQNLRDSRIFKHAPKVTAVDPPAGAVKTIVVTIPDK